MTTPPPAPPTGAQPRMFGQRDYVLPDTVHTNLPRQGYDGEPAGWHRARGLLIELCRQLPATPVALYHRTLETPAGNPVGVVVTAIVHDGDHQIITVVWRQQGQPRHGRYRRGWKLTVNGVAAPGAGGYVHASPPWLARFAKAAVNH